MFAPRPRTPPTDVCEHCGAAVDRVWLVPGDVLDSCASCFTAATGRQPVHAQGHSSPLVLRPRPSAPATFYLRVDGRRPA